MERVKNKCLPLIGLLVGKCRLFVFLDMYTAYWGKYDWNKAIEAGMKAAGQPYSSKYGFVETSVVWSANHMVSPKDKSLKCVDCHGDKGRLDWKALGYRGDPKNPANR